MKPTPKTIQIYLPGGDPRGIRIAEITTLTVQVIEVPLLLIPDFLEMPESRQVAVYYLFGMSADETMPTVYIGQTGDFSERLKAHKEKKVWDRALVLVSKTNSITQTHALFLEWKSIQSCRKVGRFKDQNGNGGTKPHTPAPLEADCDQIFETGQVLLSTLGYPIFDPIGSVAHPPKPNEIFYCKGSEADASGVLTTDGFVVLKGSSGRTEIVPSLTDSSRNHRLNLLKDNIVVEENGRYVFTKDHLFTSPSAAAVAVMGRPAGGWTEWRDQSGRTLDEVYRKKGD